MKKVLIVACSLFLMISCNKKETEKTEAKAVDYASFGATIVADEALSSKEMLEKYQTLKPGDTIEVKFKSTINEVCKKKGCWMSMQLSDDKETFVKFKDYAFFVPKNADKSEAVISGKAFVDSISVNDLQHYAKDGGKSETEIAKITTPEVKYSFLADGVLIQK